MHIPFSISFLVLISTSISSTTGSLGISTSSRSFGGVSFDGTTEFVDTVFIGEVNSFRSASAKMSK